MNNLMPKVSFLLGLSLASLGVVMNPKAIPMAAAGAGASLMAVSVFVRQHKNVIDDEQEALMATQTFSSLYETNKGLVSPEQLSINSNTPLPRVINFLEKLATETGGQKITVPTDSGSTVLYSFPHPQGALDQLTNNAIAWAEDQTKPLLQELAQLKQQVALASMLQPSQLTQEQQTVFKEQNSAPVDPWNRLV